MPLYLSNRLSYDYKCMNYSEIITCIYYGVLIFADFVVHLSHENKNHTKYNFSIDIIVACNVWNHEFKNPWINAFWKLVSANNSIHSICIVKFK
jgi:hypothetical protein